MEHFIESPQRMAERADRERRVREERQAEYAASLDLDEPNTDACDEGDFAFPPSYAADVYREERDFDRQRRRRRKAGSAMRLLVLFVLVPVAMVAVFVAAYAVTLILNGAAPEDVLVSLQGIGVRVESLLAGMASA